MRGEWLLTLFTPPFHKVSLEAIDAHKDAVDARAELAQVQVLFLLLFRHCVLQNRKSICAQVQVRLVLNATPEPRHAPGNLWIMLLPPTFLHPATGEGSC